LREQLDDAPEELQFLVAILAHKHFGAAGESITREVMNWIEQHLPREYAWPGNIRELEQCLRSIVIRRSYDEPIAANRPGPDQVVQHMLEMKLTADELMSWYCTVTHAATGSYAETARRLGVDPRTAHHWVDPKWL
jgi:transcriptional regulator of acetoin/glycerol metabolism